MAASLEVGGWRAELEGLLARFGRLFVRAEPRQQAGRYLEGLLGPVERKDGWQLAEHLGVARQYCGTLGKVENCQVGVFRAYGSRQGHALIDRRLYLPEAWTGDAERRRAAKVPEDAPFRT